jgi:hypothetical protein
MKNSLLFIIILLFSFFIILLSLPNKKEKFNSNINFSPIPHIKYPTLTFFDSQPTGYNSGTRSYSNPYFALEVAQGLDTN